MFFDFYQLQENQDSYIVKLMKERADFTRLSCEKDYRSLPTPRLLDRYGASRILVDDKRKILFCFIPKVACSNWKVVFLGLLGVIPKQDLNLVTDVHDSYQKYLNNLGRMSFREQQLRLTTYKKVMFVREPFVRLLSAFRNKFLDPNLAREWFKYVDEITTFYNRHPLLPFNRTKTWNLMKAGVSFRTLLQYLVDKRNVGEKITNTHYAIYENLCQPCKVQYDYIGEFDMLEAEANALFEDLSIDFQFPLRRGNFTAVKTSDLMREYLREVPKKLIQSVMALYSTDYIRYGYNTSVWLN